MTPRETTTGPYARAPEPGANTQVNSKMAENVFPGFADLLPKSDYDLFFHHIADLENMQSIPLVTEAMSWRMLDGSD